MNPPPADLQARVAAHLSACTGAPASVAALRPLYGGACQDNYVVDVDLPSGLAPGLAPSCPADLAGRRRLVLRSDAPSGISFTISRREEYGVLRLAARGGVRTPAVRWPARDLVRPGAYAYFMDFVPGEALGRRVLRAPELAPARPLLPDQLAAQLALIHRLTLADAEALAPDPDAADLCPPAGLPGVRRPAPGEAPADAELRCAQVMMDRLREPHPALELAMRWLREHRPTGPGADEVTLVHGDFRTGNFLVTPQGLAAVLDWEFAHFGPPMEDLAWLCVRDWRFGQLRAPVGGLCARAPFYAAYERLSGRAVRPEHVHFYEVLGNVRWALGCIDQGERYLSQGEGDLELLAIGRRAAEMEYEALRLIEQGPR
jgi:aminoglycoside phosphotransferase (APT) family kinase protein